MMVLKMEGATCAALVHLTNLSVQLLDVLKQINEREIVEVCRHFRESGGVLHSVQHLGEVITKARHATEQEIIQKMAGVSVETFYSNIGHLDRTSYNFLSDRKKLARVHRIRLVSKFLSFLF